MKRNLHFWGKCFMSITFILFIIGAQQIFCQQQSANSNKQKAPSKKSLLLSSKPLLAGQIKGVLYDSKGKRFGARVSVFVGDVINEEMNQLKIEADLKYKTNDKGEFTLENINEGRFGLCILIPPELVNYNNLYGQNTQNALTPLYGLIVSKDKPVYFTMPPNAGINLGNIKVSTLIQ